VAMRRESHTPLGGPDGGDGGKGGDVWMIADHNAASLLSFRDHPHRRADDGTHGSGKRKHGHTGEDVIVMVPEGTTVRNFDGELLADLQSSGDKWLAARGGRGGKGNARFLSNRRRAPDFAEQGEEGEENWMRLELKLLADVALVGFPNAGKSTLISRISAAKPKIANYPFTTLEPNLGVVRVDDSTELVVADIPGLIEGANEGKGLGHQFLRHIERASVLCLLVDLLPIDGRPPEEQLEVLLAELRAYQPELLDRPRVVVASKSDVAQFDAPEGTHIISSVVGTGLDTLIGKLAVLVSHAREAEVKRAPTIIHRPEPVGIWIERENNTLIVCGRSAERVVALSDVTTPDAVEYIRQRLGSLGVEKALRKAGAHQGDIVRIGDTEFEYEEDLLS
jgi:GTP-binding protein